MLGAHHHHPGALQVLGHALHSQGWHEDAVRVFNALTLMEPTIAGHWQNLATALRPTRRHAEAIAAFERALQLAPPSAAHAPADARTRWAFAQCCYDLVQYDEALAALKDWQKLEGLNVEITARTALLLVMLGATQVALPLIERLLANPPQRGRAALITASILERLHRLDEARAITKRVELDDRGLDNDPERLLLSGILADRAGQHEEAYRYLSSALQNHREFAHRHP